MILSHENPARLDNKKRATDTTTIRGHIDCFLDHIQVDRDELACLPLSPHLTNLLAVRTRERGESESGDLFDQLIGSRVSADDETIQENKIDIRSVDLIAAEHRHIFHTKVVTNGLDVLLIISGHVS
jgi:hypothetical protein